MDRGALVIATEYNGITYRSQTEARWAVFFDILGVVFKYEPERIKLSTGETYLPDFFIEDFEAYFEVKPSDEKIVTEECVRARRLAADRPEQRVWLSIGGPAPRTTNILPLERWSSDVSIGEMLASQSNRYWFHEDRRDDGVYWLHSEQVHGFPIGGPGTSTDHDRAPLNHRNVQKAYEQALAAFASMK